MLQVVLVIHLMIAVALIAVVLMQKSEGGALGIGGGMSNFMTGGGTANVLTRTTAILAACFMLTSVLLVILPRLGTQAPSIIPESSTTLPLPTPVAPAAPQPTAPAKPATPSGPTVPSGQ